MAEKPLIAACFSEACSFRYVLNHLSKEVGTVTFFFEPKKIIISVQNLEGYATIVLEIKTCELEQYEYNVRTAAGELVPVHPIVVNSMKLMLATKPIGKKDGLMLILYPGRQSLYLRTLSGRNGGPMNIIPLVDNEDHRIYVIPEFARAFDDPNVSIYAKDLSGMCNSMTITKCVRVEIALYEAGVIFTGYGADRTKLRIDPHGVCDVDVDPARIFIPIKTIKSLSKINAFSTPGSKVRVFHEDSLLKIVSPVGTYAVYTIFLRSVPEAGAKASVDPLGYLCQPAPGLG